MFAHCREAGAERVNALIGGVRQLSGRSQPGHAGPDRNQPVHRAPIARVRMDSRPQRDNRTHVCVVGSGTRFMSGISVYTFRLADALARSHDVSKILMRQLLPTRLYPGRDRVGADLTHLRHDPAVSVFDGVDWYWVPSLARALAFLTRQRPDVIVFQWWTGTVLHSYLALALAARLRGAQIVIEFHEVLDTGEASIPAVQTYVDLIAPLLVRLAHGFAVHSATDHELLGQRYKLKGRPVALFPHGPYDHYQPDAERPTYRDAPPLCCNLLYFGVIRPYKGLEDLIRAFDAMPPDEIGQYWLTVVGETWEGWTVPADLIARSRYRDRITFVNRYIHDRDVGSYFAGADAVVLPYHRSSASGPLHIAMSHGLPVVITHIDALLEAGAGYAGTIVTPVRDPEALRHALVRAVGMRGMRFDDPLSWEQTVRSYESLFATLKKRGRGMEAASAV